MTSHAVGTGLAVIQDVGLGYRQLLRTLCIRQGHNIGWIIIRSGFILKRQNVMRCSVPECSRKTDFPKTFFYAERVMHLPRNGNDILRMMSFGKIFMVLYRTWQLNFFLVFDHAFKRKLKLNT